MHEQLSQRNFGLVIAFLIPGFIALWGVSFFSETTRTWITATSQASTPTVGGFLYVTLASLAAGLTVSALRWATIDTLHHVSGIVPPHWDFAQLDDRLSGFLAIVENHYRYYQFYANSFVATAFTFGTWWFSTQRAACLVDWPLAAFIVLEGVLLAGSRDALRKYYGRADRVLGSNAQPARKVSHEDCDDQRLSSAQASQRHQERPDASG